MLYLLLDDKYFKQQNVFLNTCKRALKQPANVVWVEVQHKSSDKKSNNNSNNTDATPRLRNSFSNWTPVTPSDFRGHGDFRGQQAKRHSDTDNPQHNRAFLGIRLSFALIYLMILNIK